MIKVKNRRAREELLDNLIDQAAKLLNGMENDPFVGKNRCYAAMSKKMRVTKPMSKNILIILERRGKIKKERYKVKII